MAIVIPPATAADVADATNGIKPVTPATAKNHPAACKAWVNFNGAGVVAIRGSMNVSSITDSGTGDWRVNFTTPMADTNYAALVSTVLSITADRSYTTIQDRQTTYTRLVHFEQNVAADSADVNAAVWGAQ